jgi:hypothetical protein
LCVRCACCALPVLQSAAAIQVMLIRRTTGAAVPVDCGLPAGASLDILHIPKTLLT